MSTGSDFMDEARREFSGQGPKLAGGTVRIGVVVALWNRDITLALESGCRQTLEDAGLASSRILVHSVPGCFEIPLACRWMHEHQKVQAVVALGCLIQGETPHFEYLSQSVTQALMDLGLQTGIPMINGVLTVLDQAQAQARTGGAHGHKGEEAALAALKMLDLQATLQRELPSGR
jgi:6,7-dimethyl-8-ribityllumazine synthase